MTAVEAPADALRGRFAHLRAACEDDRDLAYELAADPVVARQWRYRPRTPSRELAYDLTIGGADAAFVVCSNRDDSAVGIVSFYNLVLADRRVSYTMAHTAPVRGKGWPMEGTGLAIDWAFRNWPIDKIDAVAEASTHMGSAASGVRRLFDVEAVVPSVAFSDGEWEDLLFVSTTRDHWLAWRDRLAPRSPG